ncbi:PorV/PorQ family protein [Capillibacterium thermochitinicola]|uniref:PorV/PorQ family protein n=1 Tax=Capillibacterium thermochitinicola TaxID=2699427 RepID=A0A8J6HYX8_9FIRM|nr:hypothetical protein [Capillibacterium thermochitinicola]MBA2132435.1 hypothetical protein [Capillibacterium thermochitinicola]
MRKVKTFLRSLLLLGFIIFFTEATMACVGARPLAMGGAFIGVADDINAVYWNPAGLVQLKEPEFTWTRTLNNRDTINYDDFLAVGSYNEESGMAYAVGYINITDYYLNYIDYYDYEILTYVDNKIQWLIFSLAQKITQQLSIGGNIRYMYFSLGFDDVEGFNLMTDSAEFFSFDLSVFYQADDRLAFGLLIQDINRPEFILYGEKWYYIRNVRPGFSYRITDSLLVSASIYDMLEEVPMDNRFRIGLEQKFDQLSIRAGLERGNKTFGLGAGGGNCALDYVYLGDDLGDTHMLGFTYKF